MILHSVYFSAKGTTRLCADCIAEGLNLEKRDYDWLTASEPEKTAIPTEDALLFSMPVYGGFIPGLCAERVRSLEGDHTPAIIAAVYGNRHYDDALLQMKELLEKRGFVVIAAGAFLAEHSIFPAVAAGRPDEKDRAAMKELAIDRENPRKTDASRCISCGACIRVCPEKARDYRGEAYLAARKGFEEKCAARREPELFYITS